MSALFFCAACGHNLTYIVNQRLKCYGCEKYFAEKFICRCPRDTGFKYSAEIIAPNKVKCLLCGKEARVPANLEPPYMHRGGGGGLGNWNEQVSGFQPSARKPKSARESRRKIEETEKPEIDYISENRDQIVIRFPGHKSIDQIHCEIVGGVLEVRSLLVDFFEKFQLPDCPVSLEVNFRNNILDIHFDKIS
jgi:hypothetical protein